VLEQNWLLFRIAGHDMWVLGYDVPEEFLICKADSADALSRFDLAITEVKAARFVLRSNIP